MELCNTVIQLLQVCTPRQQPHAVEPVCLRYDEPCIHSADMMNPAYNKCKQQAITAQQAGVKLKHAPIALFNSMLM